jgi:cytochrome c biogenesis protein
MDKGKNKAITDRVWDLFASVKLAVVIFSLIALTSMVGTVLEQGASAEKNIKILAKMFGESSAGPLYDFLQSLGFMNMYHSWWFKALLFLFAANLIICSLDRLPRIWKIVREQIHPLSHDHLEKMSIRKSLTIKEKGSGAARELVTAALKGIGFSPLESGAEKEVQYYAEKGNYTRLGVYVTHLSILVILLGAIAGVYFGFNGYLPLPEGEMSSFAYDSQDREIPLGFEVRCDRFEVEYYGQTDMPKAYKSWLTVLKDGREVMKKTITVNDPLTYNGITFYQSSFGPIPGAQDRGIAILRAVARDGKTENINARIGDTFTIPGTEVRGRITNFSTALALDQSGRPFTYDKNMVNPALFLEFTGVDGKNYSAWFLKRYPETWSLPDGSRVEFLDYWGAQYTGLQVRKDPGVVLVYLGCIIMALGLYVTFFMSHRRVWVNVLEGKGAARIAIGASANRNRASFERKIERLVGLLQAGQKGER